MAVELSPLDQRDIIAYWPILRPYFEAAIEHNTCCRDPDEIKKWALENKRIIWIVTEGHKLLAAFCSGTRTGPHGMTAYVDFIGGEDLELWIDDKLADFEERAREAGATEVELTDSRMGWARRLRKNGYKPTSQILKKVL